MDAKDLKKLTRSELLEMLLDRSKEIEHLRRLLDDANKHVASLEKEIATTGDINAAVEKLERIVESAGKNLTK